MSEFNFLLFVGLNFVRDATYLRIFSYIPMFKYGVNFNSKILYDQFLDQIMSNPTGCFRTILTPTQF